MPPKMVNFTNQQIEDTLAAERKLTQLNALLDDAESCGVQCEGYRQIQQTLLEQIRAIREKFMQNPTIQ